VNTSPAATSRSGAFELLHEGVRRWIWRQGWDSLHDVQERAIPLLLEGGRDLVITAGTASGKTEAAFLPIVSRLAADGPVPGGGFRAIYVSPMRALINDQFGRMEALCQDIEIPVTKWHGDVSADTKAKARKRPDGIVLITPESLEALLVRRGPEIGRLFRALSYVVIDEMHVFLNDGRGKQLQSILHRIDLASGARPVRVGLSATLADEDSSRAFLRPMDPAAVVVLPPGPTGLDLRLQLRGYVRPARAAPASSNGVAAKEPPPDSASTAVAKHLFETHRGSRSLIFAGSRGMVEKLAVDLDELTERAGVPGEFLAHHGNLSREHREDAERRMKDRSQPASIVCTTTLELGIDVGEIECVAQLGPGHTVSGMRQRLGRSGRRPGKPAVMRVYVTEFEIDDKTPALDALRPGMVQSIAMIELMIRRWNEPPEPGRLHLSTLLQQIMALISQRGGVRPEEAWRDLMASGVFAAVDPGTFKALLRRMGHAEVGLIEQAPDGTLLPGSVGERLIDSRDIFSVFMSPEEFRVIERGGRAIGQVPATNPIIPGQQLILAGRRWRVIDVDPKQREVVVERGRGGIPPLFDGAMRPPADIVVAEMRRVWENITVPTYLDDTAIALLAEGRTTYDRLGLRHRTVAQTAGQLLLFPWVGERKMNALRLALARDDVKAAPLGVALSVPNIKADDLADKLNTISANEPPDPISLAALAGAPRLEKFDEHIGGELLTLSYASSWIDASTLPAIAGDLSRSLRRLESDA
jgi:ATP-dependent Lhr-like helicase